MILLDSASFVVDVERGDHSIRDDSGTKTAGCASGDPAVENELHLLGATNVEVFSDNIFKENAARDGSVEYLREGQFDLENGELITVSGMSISGRKRMG